MTSGACGLQEPFDLRVLTLPDRRGGGERSAARSRENEPTAAPVVRIDDHFHQTAALERLEIGGQRRAIEREQIATEPMFGGSARLSEVSSENWPWVSPTGRNASSKRRASARAARCTCRHRQ